MESGGPCQLSPGTVGTRKPLRLKRAPNNERGTTRVVPLPCDPRRPVRSDYFMLAAGALHCWMSASMFFRLASSGACGSAFLA